MSNVGISDSMDLSADEMRLLDFLLEQEGFDLPKPKTIFPRGEQTTLPLSFAQERLWFLDQWDPGTATYNVPSSMRLAGRLDVGALWAGLNAVIQRHEALRTTFPAANGLPTQVIAARLALPLALVDLQALPDALREDTALRLLTAGARGAFDLASGPLVRVLLIRLSAAEHAFLLNMHHIVCDGWSMAIFIQELAALYRAFRLGQTPELPALAIQYADFALWQRSWLQGAVLETQLEYWRAQLSGRFPVLELPTDRPRPPVQTHRGARESFSIAEATVAALELLCQQQGATRFMALLAGFNLLLARYSGQTDIIVGAPIANRDLVEVEGLIGYFVNTLVLRTDLARPASFHELLQQVRDTTLDAHAHQNIPFEQLVEKLQSERDPSRTALFQVMFVLQNTPPAVYELPDLTMRAIIVETGTAKFDLLLGLSETPHGLRGGIEYNRDLFDATTIQRMLHHYQTLLRHAAADPAQRLADLPLLSAAERMQLLVGWNQTDVSAHDSGSVEQLIAGQAVRQPDAVALVWRDQHLTYRVLDERAGELAAHLRARGVGPETLVGLHAERSLALIVELLGVLKAGGAYLPLDPGYPAERLRFMLDDSQAIELLTTTTDERRWTMDDLGASDTSIVNRTSKIVNPDNLAYVIYTSGSTGTPKGVLVTRQGLVNHCRAVIDCYGLSAADRVLQLASLSFDLAAEEIYPALASGATLVLWPHPGPAAPHEFLGLAERERLTMLDLTTPLWQAWATDQATLARHLPAALRLVIVGGDRALTAPYAAWRRAVPARVRWINSYGPTEATIIATLDAPDADAPLPPSGGMAIGRPIANTRVYLLDHYMQPVPIGVAGEVCIGGAGVARGYLGRSDLTAERFVPNPFATLTPAAAAAPPLPRAGDKRSAEGGLAGGEGGTRLYRTGDLARYLPDGTIEYLGRRDHQVKLRGYRIELGEIAAVLVAQPQVRDAVVLLREDGPGMQRLVAYVVPTEDERRTTNEIMPVETQYSASVRRPSSFVSDLRAFLAARLPSYMLPSAFVWLDALPLTSTGKLDRNALPAPEPLGAQPSAAEPRTPTEELLAGIWAEVLRRDQIGVDDNFFALGGHSLLATQVIARIRDAFAVELPLRTLFETPTVAGLAAQFDRRRTDHIGLAAPALVPAQRTAALPLSFAQARLWFLDQLDPGSSTYIIPTPVRLIGALDVAALQASFSAILARHEALRTTFQLVDGQPVQLIAAPTMLRLAQVELDALPTDVREAVAQQLVRSGARAPFDLGRGPLVRTMLLRLDAQTHLLLISMHHIISDGWSVGVLIRELTQLYAAFRRGQTLTLPPLPIQYADYALWQRQWLQGALLDAQLAYWQQQLVNAPPVLELPTDHPRPAVLSVVGASQPLRLDTELTRGLHALSRQAGTTLFMTLLAAFDVLLARWSGQNDLAIGTPIANRTQAATEGLIGFFVNTLVLRTQLRGTASFEKLLGQVRATCLDAYAHQDVPFEQLVERLQPVRDLSTTPLFQVMLVLQNAPQTALDFGDLTLRPLANPSTSAKFDLTLTLSETARGLVGGISYRTTLFEATTITRLGRHLTTLLAGIVADPTQRIADLPLMTAAERAQLLVAWNDTAGDYAHDRPLHALITDQAARTPDSVAVIFQTQHLSYAELARRANQLGRYLQTLGVGPEVVVGVCLERSAAQVLAILGVLSAGGTYLPLDPSLPSARLAFMLADSQASVLLTTTKDEGRLTIDDLGASDSTIVNLDVDWLRIANQPVTAPDGGATAANLAYLIYTSGSTGTPKAVAVSHRAIVNHLRWRQASYPLGSADRFLHKAASGFDIAVWEVFGTLAAGAQLVLAEPGGQQDAAYLARLIAEQAITVAHFGPAMLQVVLEQPAVPGWRALRQAFCGGEALTPGLRSRFFARVAAGLCHQYGPTEATVDATAWDCLPGADGALVPIGRPIANTQTYVLDAQMAPVPIGVAGELYIGGASLARGYLHRPDLTAERFVPNPFTDCRLQIADCRLGSTDVPIQNPKSKIQNGTRLYKTGDLARWLPDGTLEFLGRIDQQVKLRGYRIELGEIAAALVAQPQVRDAVVLLREDMPGDQRLVAYVVPIEDERRRTNEIVSVETQYIASLRRPSSIVSDLRAFLKTRLPEYMLPSAFVLLDALPLTLNGKLDRRALPAPDHAIATTGYLAPRDATEELLAGIWADVLGCERVGLHDNFFELGGHSLLATQVIARVRQLFAIELPLRDLFEQPTVVGLAARIEITRQQQATTTMPPPPLQPQPRGERVPLSFAQQRLWFLTQLDPSSPAYHLPYALQLSGPLDLAALARTLAAVVARHESLRTTFALHDGQPIQQIMPPAALALPLYDLRALAPTQQVPLVQTLVRHATQAPFDLARGPLLRVALLRLAADAHVLLLTMHHIISDGWSQGVLIRELMQHYAAFRSGQVISLPPLPIQYADYALWQRQWLQGEVLDAQLAYWQRRLADAPPVLELPTDHPRPAVLAFAGARQPLALDAALLERLHTLSRQAGTTLFMTLLAAFDVLLARWSGQDDILVGTPIANRTQAATEGLIGFFVNTLVLRTQLRGAHGFVQLLGQVRSTCLDAYAHQDMPFEQLVEVLQPVRNLSTSPLFQVMLVLQNTLQVALDLAELTFRPVVNPSTSAKFDLTLSLTETTQGLTGGIEYRTALFEAATITRLVGHFQTLLAGIVAAPEQPIADLPLLTEAEREQIVGAWNATQVDYPLDALAYELAAAQAARTPDAIALICQEQHLSYAELERRANQLAHWLRAAGVGPEIPVAMCLDRSPELVVAALGVLKAGGAYVPLDPAYPPERLAYMLVDCRAPVLLSLERLRGHIPQHSGITLCLDLAAAALAQLPVTVPLRLTDLDNLAYVIYTSGSTGQPKGVEVSHRGLLNLVQWHQQTYEPTSADRTMLIAGVGFDAVVWELWPQLAAGTSIHIPDNDTRGSPLELHDWLIERELTLCFLPTPLAEAMLTLEWPVASPLRYILTGGDRLRQPPSSAIGFTLVNHYGPTEATVLATCAPITPQMNGEELPPIGRPIANTQVYVLDRQLQPVPLGVAGELYIGGVQLARGYLGRPELTAERFIPNPFAEVSGAGYQVSEDKLPDTRYPTPATRLYKTGDLARFRPTGTLDFLGRIDQQIKLRGYRIELGEIEAALTAHPAVRDAVLLLREDVPGLPHLVAYVVPAEDERRTTNEIMPVETQYIASVRRPSSIVSDLRAFLAARLPEYMLPSAFVLLDALPLTPNGKLDRAALPALEQMGTQPTAAEPRTPTEELLAGIWAEVLRRDQVGVDDNFFALGGHSLLATQVIARIRDAFAVELPLRTLFETPTVAGLAAQLERRRDHVGLTVPALVPAQRPAALPLSFAQARLWFLDQLDPGSSTYIIPTPVRLIGALDLAALQASFSAILARHEALRTTFQLVDGQPVQVIAAPTVLALAQADLCALPAGVREAVAQQLVRSEARAPFDLGRGPLIRTMLLRLDAQTHLLLISMHHIISDGWSQSVLIRELTQLYAAFRSGQALTLPPLPIQYADYALWQRQWLQGTTLDAQLAYWKAQLADAPPVLELPTDHPRPAVLSVVGASQPLRLDMELTRGLHALSRQAGTTLFMTLLAAFDVLLARYSGQSDIVVGTPIANRTQAATEGLIGCFVNTLVLRTQLSGAASFGELLEQVRATCLDAYAHQDVPFEQLVELLQPVRDLSTTPLFQVMLVLQNTPQTALDFGDLTLRPLANPSTSAKFDLTLTLSETARGLVGSIEYRTTLFTATTIARLERHLTTLLAGIVADPASRIAALPLLTVAERAQLLVAWNDTAVAYPDDQFVQQLFAAQAARTPDSVAVSFQDQQLSYAELARRANQLAWLLRARGVGPEVLVGVCLERSLELVIGLLGVLAAGGAYLPLDPGYPPERLRFMIDDSRAQVLITTGHPDRETRRQEDKEIDTLHGSVSPDLLVSRAVLDLRVDWPLIAQQPVGAPIGGAGAANPAYVLYTSGSTGTPKGVVVTHQALSNHMYWLLHAYPLIATDRLLQKTAISFDASVWEFYAPLLAGAQLVLAEPGGQRDSAYLVQTISAQQISLLQLVPTMLRALLEEPGFAGCGSLRRVFCGGEVLPRELSTWFLATLDASLHNFYGPTEATIDSIVWNCAGVEAGAAIPIGRAVANTRAYLLDAAMRPVPIGVAGELYIAGAQLARGYLHRPDLTAERFVPNPFAGDKETRRQGDKEKGEAAEPQSAICNLQSAIGTRLYKTGDLARWRADGAIEYLGRTDYQVKLRGYRIELDEIAAALAAQPQVRDAVVLLREDMPGDQRLVAYVVPIEDERRRTNEIVSVETQYSASVRRPSSIVGDLRTFLAERLPEYMLPSAFVLLDALPLTPSGKLDRNALPAPDQRAESSGTVGARDRLELQLVQLWEELLAVRPIGVKDSFFVLGGHSLLAVRLMARLRELTGVALPLATLFRHPTIAQLAQLLRDQTAPAAASALVGITTGGSKRPLFCIHPLGGNVLCYAQLARQLGPEQPVYGLQAPGLEHDQALPSTVEAMAQEYVAAIRAVQPAGSYLLCGWSVGGVIALEIAQQLVAQGQTVALLALLDSYASQPTEVWVPNERQLLLGMAQQLGVTLDAAALESLDAEQQLAYVLAQAQRNDALLPGLDLAQFGRLFAVYKANAQALLHYTPRPYAGRVTLFRAEDAPAGLDPAAGWHAIARDGVLIYDAPGAHNTMLQEPHAGVLAEQLNAVIAQSLGEATTSS